MNKYFISIIFSILVGLSVISCGGNSYEIEYIPSDGVILAFGDSLTHGSGVNKSNSYPSQLQILTERKVINAGIPGELSADGLKRLPALLDQHNPNLLILTHGGNDMLRKKDLTLAADNLRSMIREAQNRGISVIMMAVPNPTLILSPADFYEAVANDMGVLIDVDTISDVLQFPSNKSDAIHPNEKGYRVMAENLQNLLEKHGAL
ncbi:MAG: arylesterase [Gammaproteobacteria bacterium]|nr:MAG: arylesterase [Gammaproteobacteria bacterium]